MSYCCRRCSVKVADLFPSAPDGHVERKEARFNDPLAILLDRVATGRPHICFSQFFVTASSVLRQINEHEVRTQMTHKVEEARI